MNNAKFISLIFQKTKENIQPVWVEWNGTALNLHFKIPDFENKIYQNYWLLNQEDLEEIEKTFLVKLPSWPPEQYIKSRTIIFKNVLKKNDQYKEYILSSANKYISPKLYGELLLQYCEKLSNILSTCNFQYWNILKNNKIVFSHCCKINKEGILNVLNDPQASGKDALNTFLSEENKPFSYVRFNTRTGRMTRLSGPNILLLKKNYRKYILSNFNHGELWSFDYSSIEPRILLIIKKLIKSNNIDISILLDILYGNLPRHKVIHHVTHDIVDDIPEDIYSKFIKDLNLNNIPREIAKNAILSSIYGQNKDITAKNIRNYVKQPYDFLNIINDYFGINDLFRILLKEFEKSNKKQIKSFYGRPIFCDENSLIKLVNYYIQATAVDAALSGFKKIINNLKNKKEYSVIPLFCIHDALILDINLNFKNFKNQISEIEKIGSTGILGFEMFNFFLKARKFVSEEVIGKSETAFRAETV